MKIGDRVVISEQKHPLYDLEGSVVGFRGERAPGDLWLLILIFMRNRSYYIPQSMVKIIGDENNGDGNGRIDIFNKNPRPI